MKTAMNPPIRGQNTAETIPQACSATCSLAEGKAQATCRRRSWRNTNRSWLGGRRPSGWAGRNVAHGPLSDTAQSICARKKQSSQLAFALPLRPLAMPLLQPSVRLRRTSPSVHIKALPRSPRKLDFRKTQQLRNILNYLEIAGIRPVRIGTTRIFRSFVTVMIGDR